MRIQYFKPLLVNYTFKNFIQETLDNIKSFLKTPNITNVLKEENLILFTDKIIPDLSRLLYDIESNNHQINFNTFIQYLKDNPDVDTILKTYFIPPVELLLYDSTNIWLYCDYQSIENTNNRFINLEKKESFEKENIFLIQSFNEYILHCFNSKFTNHPVNDVKKFFEQNPKGLIILTYN